MVEPTTPAWRLARAVVADLYFSTTGIIYDAGSLLPPFSLS